MHRQDHLEKHEHAEERNLAARLEHVGWIQDGDDDPGKSQGIDEVHSPLHEDAEAEGADHDSRADHRRAGAGEHAVANGEDHQDDRDLQARIFKLLGLTEDYARDRFGFLLDAFEYGAPPHGGIALGIDRLAMLILGLENIRDVITCPKTQSTVDLMMGAPGIAVLLAPRSISANG